MKIAVIGGTGRIGSKVVNRIRDYGHKVVAASPRTGVDTITREGLSEALDDVDVVVDVTDSRTTEEGRATWFFSTSTMHLLAEEKAAGVSYHVGLSILGADRMTSGYFRAKLAQEALVRESGISHTILRSTSFFESMATVAADAMDEHVVRLPPVPIQPVAADDVAAYLAHLVFISPGNDTLELAGPEQLSLDEFARRVLRADHDNRKVVADAHAPYLGAVFEHGDHSLLPDLRVAPTRLEDWLRLGPHRWPIPISRTRTEMP